ncbi:hypothetical protein AJ79_05200 [Helicocarpus griseus UAMH5409]|uniref:Hpc2-related domain-containing protein n=1 Tax=Helicocarpus griseus UAMH5409 TaxID=1447875 RepID=A0A2B7XGV3_9EURO|nr:hypothetical protein AJ79_05200 [Helicocarpus griseus UAMH5409]
MSGDAADEGWRGRGRTRRSDLNMNNNNQQQQQQQQHQQHQPQGQEQEQQQLQHPPPTTILGSSSPDLSSPNLSDCESVPTPAQFRSRASSPNTAAQNTSTTAAAAAAAAAAPGNAAPATKNSGKPQVKDEKQAGAPAPKMKRTRKKKEDKEPKEAKEKDKETKPRRRRTSNKNNNNANNAAQAQNQQDAAAHDNNADRATSRKKAKLEHPQETKPIAPARQSKITDLVTPNPPATSPSTISPTQPTSSSTPYHFAPSSTSNSPRLQPHLPHGMSQNGNYDVYPANGSSRPAFRPYHIQPAPSSTPALAPAPVPSQHPCPPQRSSGQNYDPIRSAFDNSSVTAPHVSASSKITLPSGHHHISPPPNTTRTPPPRPVYRASASPAISSIIDPPVQPPASAPPQAGIFTHHHRTSPGNTQSVKHSPASITATTNANANAPPTTIQQPKAVHQPEPSSSLLQEPVAMEVDTGNGEPAPAPPASTKLTAPAPNNNNNNNKKGAGASTGPPSSAPSPKPPRPKDAAPPPLPSGSGLLAGALFGVDASNNSNSTSSKTTPNIILHIPLDGKSNQIINFTRLAEEQYGFDALHPRLAAQRERLARVNAASAALEKNEKNAKGLGTDSAAEDDVSLDVDRDSDGDGDVQMSGMASSAANGHAGSEAGAADGKKKRRRKIEEYDRDDPFVDDSELAWQEHAAASKDGFFVYSGPLVPEGEKVAVERADGSIKRGRGRGRGGASAGSRRGGGAAGHHTGSAQDGAAGGSGSTGRGGGPGSRGGTTRKARVTKASRETMQKEKMERQKMGMELAAKGGGTGGGAMMV